MSLLRVHLLVERDRYGNSHGSGHIRLLRPFSHPILSECFQVTTGEAFPQGGVDVVLVERGWRADASLEMAENLVASIRALGATLIYTLDDNLLDLHRCQPWHEYSTDAKRSIVRYFLRQADGVVVSTEPLRQRLRKLNSAICVVPNALDERLFLSEDIWNEKKPAGEPLVIGYMGTHSHLDDLMMVLEPMRSILRKYQGRIEFQIVGISEDNRVIQCFESLPFRILNTEGSHFYPDFVPWAKKNMRWDLAIAPLEDNVFNDSKSDIKFLDYSMLGIAGIYSDVGAYKHSVEHGETGWLCDNASQAWKSALERMIEDALLRKSIALSAFDFVSGTRLLNPSAMNWKNAVLSCSGSN